MIVAIVVLLHVLENKLILDPEKLERPQTASAHPPSSVVVFKQPQTFTTEHLHLCLSTGIMCKTDFVHLVFIFLFIHLGVFQNRKLRWKKNVRF